MSNTQVYNYIANVPYIKNLNYGKDLIFNNSLIDKNYGKDDEITEEKYNKMKKKLDFYDALPQYEQKSINWLNQRRNYICGSEAGSVLGLNSHEDQYEYLLNKISENNKFINFELVYHGNKHEDDAKHVYEALTNTHVSEYGFIPGCRNEKISIYGASPDGIVSCYKNDMVHKTNKIGRMLEIKCPARRKINMDLNAKIFDIIPLYYYPQVVQQLETCELDYCDFWQCDFKDYKSKKQFDNDKGAEDYLTQDGKFKGCLIQILPKNIFQEYLDNGTLNTNSTENKFNNIYNKICAHAKFIHPSTILQTNKEREQWIKDVKNQTFDQNLAEFYKIKEGYFIHKVIYWKLVKARCYSIKRNQKYFNENFEIYQQLWNYKNYFCDIENVNKKDILINFIHYCQKHKKNTIEENKKLLNLNNKDCKLNTIIMQYVDYLYKYDIDDEKNKIIIEYAEKNKIEDKNLAKIFEDD
jgi:putative phage-type endonuclease